MFAVFSRSFFIIILTGLPFINELELLLKMVRCAQLFLVDRWWFAMLALPFRGKGRQQQQKRKTNEKSTIYSEKTKRVSEYCSATTDQLKVAPKSQTAIEVQREKVTKNKKTEKIVE